MRITTLFSIVLLTVNCHSVQKKTTPLSVYDQYPAYNGADLGMNWSVRQSTFKLWSPAAEEVRMQVYKHGDGGTALQVISLKKQKQGVWQTTLDGDQKGLYYTVQIKMAGAWLAETPDPYAKAVGVNGQRGMIVDLASTNPARWDSDQKPVQKQFTDIILYELHVRDLSAYPNSGLQNKGKYLAFTEKGAKNSAGKSTGIDHLKELGITHVHLLPAFDFRYTSVDESKPPQERKYNWGYDPENYNTPEGSYATDAHDGAVRIREYKQAVQALHANGMRVVMDVVYNHTGSTTESVFNRVAPGYYYRQNPDGSYSNASACGNETASERAMVRQYIVESVKYWAQEYHIDGFRFDLMGIHDIATMNAVSKALHDIDPTIFIYGEGWTAGSSPLPEAQRALKANTAQLDRVAAFSDDFRDALKGSVFDHLDRGFVSGKAGMEESIKFGIVASIQHPQVDYNQVNYSKAPWAAEPFQTINYAECHDNHTLWDKLAISCKDDSEEDRIRMHRLAITMVLTSQGIPFIHAGAEMLRTKNGVENSFNAPDAVNWINWDRKTQYADVMEAYKALIQLRKNHPAFRLPTAALIREHLHFLDTKGANLIAYQLSDYAGGDAWKDIIVVFNGSPDTQTVFLPKGNWTVVLDRDQINEAGLRTMTVPKVNVPGISAMVLVRN